MWSWNFSKTNTPDPHQWSLNSCFGAFRNFGCIWDRFVTARNSVQNGPTGTINAKAHAMKSRGNITLRTQLIHTIGPQTHVLVRFIVFGCICDRFVTTRNSVQMGQLGAINANVHATKRHRNCSLSTHPIHINEH
jgi:hypothetical protein